MSKMKYLWRKLHIGGGGAIGGSSSGAHHHRPVADPIPATSSKLAAPIATSSASSSSSRVIRAATAAPETAEPPAREGGAAAEVAAAAVGDFSFFEEEYQVQLALAISASDPDGLEDPDAVQMKAATQISLGCAPSAPPKVNRMEYLSVQYWNYNVVDYDEKLMDGFYDVYAVTSGHQLQGQMPSLVDLQAMPSTDNIEYEVVVVNRAIDHALQNLEKRALAIASEGKVAQAGPIASGLVQKLANLVVDNTGGPVTDTEDILRRWRIKSHELRTSLKTVVLPLGSLEIGLSRHRALLFKVLADRVNLPCRLLKGSYYTGTDEGAVNYVKVDYDSEFIIDLMGAPGTLIPAEVPSRHLHDSGLNLVGSNAIQQTVKDLCLALDNMGSEVDGKSGIMEGSSENMGSECVVAPFERVQIDGSRYNLPLYLTAKSENDHAESIPLEIAINDISQVGESPSAEQMKVNDVSKYVVTAARNPEFAQKLHAALLESGAAPPPNLFSDLDPSDRQIEEASRESMCVRKNDCKLPQDNLSLVYQPFLILSSEGESSNCTNAMQKQHKRSRNACISQMSYETNLCPPCVSRNESKISSKSTCSHIPFLDCKDRVTSMIQNAGNASGVSTKNGSNLSLIQYGDGFGEDPSLDVLEAPKHSEGMAEQKLATENISDYCKELSRDSAKQVLGTNYEDLQGSDGASNDKVCPVLDVSEWETPWEDLQIGERIGLGSFGEVYRADWNGTEVAVKKFLDQGLSGDALEQFRSEVKIMSRVRHPNVVLFMGAVTRPPNLSILTEFLPRGSLYRLLHRSSAQLDEKRRLRMALDVARGMNYLHSSHPTIVHRDLKSPNLLVDKNWVVKVCDFGLSRLKHHTFLSSKSTAGTPEWMAPEVLRNERSNEKCDVYSFGVILWELTTLRTPWSGMNPMQVVGAVGFQNRRLDIPKEVDPKVADIISSCWLSEPSERPSFAQLLSPLKQLQRLVVAND